MDARRTEDTVDEVAGIRWRQGLQARMPKLWLDPPRAGGWSLLPSLDVPVPPRARVLTSAVTAALAGLQPGRAMAPAYGQPFQLGAGAVELLPSGAVVGGTLARLHTRRETVLVVREAAFTPSPLALPLELREADVLVVDAGMAEAPVLGHERLTRLLTEASKQGEPAVWLLQHPSLALSLLAATGLSLRLAPPLRRLHARAVATGLVLPPAELPGRGAAGILLWPLALRHTVPRAWQDVSQVVVAEFEVPHAGGLVRLPYSQRLAGPALDTLHAAANCRTTLAYGAGAAAWVASLNRRGHDAHVLRVPRQLPLLSPTLSEAHP